MPVQPRREIRTLTKGAESSGSRIARMRAEYRGRIIKLSSNEGPWPPFPSAIEAMIKAVAEQNRYSDPDSKILRAKLADLHDVPPEYITVAAGSSPIIKQIFFTFINPGDEVVMPWPTFPSYVSEAEAMGAESVKVPLRNDTTDLPAILDSITPRTKLVCLCNPNNPTGTVNTREEMDEYLSEVPDSVITLVDEAYYHFADPATFPQIDRYIAAGGPKPVIMLRTFSKAYAMAGARMGYGIVPPDLMRLLDATKAAYPVNHVGLAGAAASVADQSALSGRIAMTVEGRAYLHGQLDAMGLRHTDSKGNFLFVDFGRDSNAIDQGLMMHGILCKTGHQYDSPTWLRVTVGLPEENEAFIAALKQVLAEV
ncbi:MAG: histidinol-phosphate transaminase [Chloroflexi bacterium]|nr:histidinol-phosphate transaminase [Chloroflexota bacterium]